MLNNMNRYFLVVDAKSRLVFKKKLDKGVNEEKLASEFNKLDYICYFLEGKSLGAALSENGVILEEESAFFIKKELKEEFYFTDKKIKELLGQPDRIEKVKGSSKGSKDKTAHLYSKSRVETVLNSPEYKTHADTVRSGRERKGQREQEEALDRPKVIIPLEKPVFYNSRSEKFAKDRLKQLVSKLRKDWDLNEYKEFFPAAREIRRKHIFFVGPTNSGKSYRGFNELALGFSGVYLAPLRLLALEGQEEIEKRGKECSLLTGEEVEIKEDATFVASTVEMANLDRPIDCALIDEVQLILDKNRGWAWSQAIVGIPAKTIIMTGSDECIPTLKRLIEDYLGEELEIVRLNRIGKLEIHNAPTRNLSQVEAGTAVIAFSRRGVLAFKKELEDDGRKVSVLYGNLSPGVRREEARRFRSGETDVLVATDCIGMGLNLPIKTVLFSETTKFDGKEVRDLTPQEIKQIAGRAGRFGKFECGYVGATSKLSIQLISNVIDLQQPAVVESCVVRPTETQLEVLREQIGNNNIKNALSLFTQLSKTNSTLVCSDLSEMIDLAGNIELRSQLAELPFVDKYVFICAPVSATDMVMEKYVEWLVSYSKKTPVLLRKEEFRTYTREGSTSEDSVLNHAENCVKMLTLYHWLARKKPEYFPSLEICEEIRDEINGFIENSLKKRGLHRKCPECFRKMPVHHVHKLCDECFKGSRRRRYY
jgi:ATP-dependent RNA helicase SUPV3L1/SUV3